MKRILSFIAFALLSTPALATQVQEVKSKSGLTAWLVEEHSLPVVAVEIAFRGAGYAYDAQGLEGRANMTAAMLNEGAGDMDSHAFNEALEAHAIELNAGADNDLFNTSITTLSEHKDLAFGYLGLALNHPRFDREALERTRSQALAVLVEQEQSPGYQLSQRWREIAYGSHPYANPQAGTNDSIRNISADDLRSFVSHYLTKENIIIGVSGDITPAELSDLLDKNLGSLPAHYDPDVKLADVKIADGGKPTIIDFDIPQTMVAFGTNGVKRSDPDYFPTLVMNQILGGGLDGRLGKEIREKRGLAYSVVSVFNTQEHSAAWSGEFSTRNEKVGEALKTFDDTLRAFLKSGPTDQEMKDAKQYLNGSFVLRLDSNQALANFLVTMQFYHLARDYIDKRAGMVDAVTKAQVALVARKLIDPDKLVTVMIGKPALGEKP